MRWIRIRLRLRLPRGGAVRVVIVSPGLIMSVRSELLTTMVCPGARIHAHAMPSAVLDDRAAARGNAAVRDTDVPGAQRDTRARFRNRLLHPADLEVRPGLFLPVCVQDRILLPLHAALARLIQVHAEIRKREVERRAHRRSRCGRKGRLTPALL
jgi:hypothetical protein